MILELIKDITKTICAIHQGQSLERFVFFFHSDRLLARGYYHDLQSKSQPLASDIRPNDKYINCL